MKRKLYLPPVAAARRRKRAARKQRKLAEQQRVVTVQGQALDICLEALGMSYRTAVRMVRDYNADYFRTGNGVAGPPTDLVLAIFDLAEVHPNTKLLAVRALQDMAWRI